MAALVRSLSLFSLSLYLHVPRFSDIRRTNMACRQDHDEAGGGGDGHDHSHGHSHDHSHEHEDPDGMSLYGLIDTTR